MKKIISLLLALSAVIAVLSSCNSAEVKLIYKDGKLIDKKNDITYSSAPLTYGPVSIGEEYAYYKDADKSFYEIPGLSPKQWLTEEDYGSTTTVFYADGVILPTLSEMNPNKAYICQTIEKTYSLATIDDKKTINYLVTEFKNGESVFKPVDGSVYAYELKFHSESKYPYLYYTLWVYKYADGVYLYDKISKRCVKVDDVFYDYLGI